MNQIPIRPGAVPQLGRAAGIKTGQASGSRPLFAALLDVEQRRGIEARDLKVSGHASSRLREAGRTLTEDEVSLVNTAVDRAASKGARESLIVMNGMALVVSVPNRTVITAVTGERCKENVFTNIDSAIIMSGLDLS